MARERDGGDSLALSPAGKKSCDHGLNIVSVVKRERDREGEHKSKVLLFFCVRRGGVDPEASPRRLNVRVLGKVAPHHQKVQVAIRKY